MSGLRKIMVAGLGKKSGFDFSYADDAHWLASHAPSLPLFHDLAKAAAFLRAGGILVYPTETFYAIGCRADNEDAANAIMALKNRKKPMPVLAASNKQAAEAAKLEACPDKLLAKFWPGPLAVILPARNIIARACKDDVGECAIRVTSSGIAAALASISGFALSASSANLSGFAPARELGELGEAFLEACVKTRCAIVALRDNGRNIFALPSTIVRPLSDGSLSLVRPGCIGKAILESEGFHVVKAGNLISANSGAML